MPFKSHQYICNSTNNGCFWNTSAPRLPGLPTAPGACIVICANCPKRIYEIYPRRSLSTSAPSLRVSSTPPHPAGCPGMLHPLSAGSHKKTQSLSFKRHQRAGISLAPAGTDASSRFQKESRQIFLHVGHFPDWIGLVSIWIMNRLLNYTAHRSKYF